MKPSRSEDGSLSSFHKASVTAKKDAKHVPNIQVKYHICLILQAQYTEWELCST